MITVYNNELMDVVCAADPDSYLRKCPDAKLERIYQALVRLPEEQLCSPECLAARVFGLVILEQAARFRAALAAEREKVLGGDLGMGEGDLADA